MKPARLRLKPGVVLEGAQPQLLEGIAVALRVWGEAGLDWLTITAALDGQHMTTSLHYKGLAADIRTHDVRDEGRDPLLLVVNLRKALGPDWDVILESVDQPGEHIHAEFDPKPRKAAA